MKQSVALIRSCSFISMHSFLSVSHKMPILLEFLCLNELSEIMQYETFLKGWNLWNCVCINLDFFVFSCVCVCCAFMCALMYAHTCMNTCAYGDPRMMLGSFLIALLPCSLKQDLPIRPGIQLASSASFASQLASAICLPSEARVADTTWRLHGSSGSELWSSCLPSKYFNKTTQPSHSS